MLYHGVNLDFEGLGYQDDGEQLRMVHNSFTKFGRLLAEQVEAANLTLTLTLHAPNRRWDYWGFGNETLTTSTKGFQEVRAIIWKLELHFRARPETLLSGYLMTDRITREKKDCRMVA